MLISFIDKDFGEIFKNKYNKFNNKKYMLSLILKKVIRIYEKRRNSMKINSLIIKTNSIK